MSSQSSTIESVIDQWHKLLASKDLEALDQLLHDDVVFHSPVVHTPQQGKTITKMYLRAAFYVLLPNGFRYLREVQEGNLAVLEFEAKIDDIIINGVDMIECSPDGQITDFKVMIRPVKAIEKIQEKMTEILNKS
ncbi:MAG: nuclear transport factor 2 family protein [Xanthomonadales bacterium]|nr:nuclear transport factor 2 family protein [Xanthomonadales bacterium]